MQITFDLKDTKAILQLLHRTNQRNEKILEMNQLHGGNDDLINLSDMAKIVFLFGLAHYSGK